MRYFLVLLITVIGCGTAGVAGTVMFLEYTGTQVNCEQVRTQGTALRVKAEGSKDLAEQIRINDQMLTKVDTNRSCFTDAELADVEVARDLMGNTAGGTDG